MPLSYNMNGTWKTVRYAYAKASGSWKSVGQIWVKRSGTWYRIWTYSWTTGSWGSCSADCGGGTQTRSVTCTRNDGYTFDDSYCTTFGAGTKPSTSQSCNTDSCEECCSGNSCRCYGTGEGECSNSGKTVNCTYESELVASDIEFGMYTSDLTWTSGGYSYVASDCSCSTDRSTGGESIDHTYTARCTTICRTPV